MRILLVTFLTAASALAAPSLHVKNGQTIRVVLGDKKEKGIGLRPARSEWRLELARSEADSAEVIDITAGVVGMKWELGVADSALLFDHERFVADHAYRVELKRGQKSLGVAIVYLYPPKVAARQQLRFDDSDGSADGELGTVPKPTL